MILTLNYVNVNNLVLMKYRIIAHKTDAGLYSLEFESSQTTLKIFKTTMATVWAIVIIFLDLVLILWSMVDISD